MDQEKPQDEYAGQGGSYLVGKDGKRVLVHRTKDPEPVAQPAPAASTEQTKE